MKTRWWLRIGAVLGVLALVAAGCGDDDGDDDAQEPEEEEEVVEADPATDRLVIGRILPETGSLAFLGHR